MFNEEGNVGRFVSAVEEVMLPLGESFEIIMVDDGSRDGTWERITEQSRRVPYVRGISLSRNFGHQNALFAGLHHARGRAVISMDGDLQHPPSLIPKLLEAWHDGYQIVTTTRHDSVDTSWFKRLSSRTFYHFFSALSGVRLTAGSSDFRLLDGEAQRAMLEMRDVDLFLRGMVSWLGYRSTNLSFQADPRRAGATKYTVGRMVRFSTGAMLAFSMMPLKAGIWLGFLTSILAMVGAVLVTIDYFQGNTVRGWASVMVVMSFMFAVCFVLLGTIGLYLGKIFEILKGRQRFIVGARVGFEDHPVPYAISG
jgi:dolichol-phosphate mannosyltransferase